MIKKIIFFLFLFINIIANGNTPKHKKLSVDNNVTNTVDAPTIHIPASVTSTTNLVDFIELGSRSKAIPFLETLKVAEPNVWTKISNHLDEAQQIKIAKDLINPQFVDFKDFILANPNKIDAWEVLLRNGRTGGNIPANALTRNIDALTSLNTLLNNSKLASKLPGKTTIEIENLLAKMNGWSGASYKQVCDKVNLLITELPTNVTGLDKYLGSAGFGMQGTAHNTWRHSWVQLERLLVNKQKLKIADEIVFERQIINTINGTSYTSVTDVYIKIGLETFEIETKAGIKFFENVTNNSSNFSRQSFNSLTNVNKLENYKIFLNPTVKNALGNSDKLDVINAWKNFEGGTLYELPGIKTKFEGYGMQHQRIMI